MFEESDFYVALSELPAPNHDCCFALLQAKKARPGDVLSDSRFAAMFEERDFEVDLDADEYKQLHPNAGKNQNDITGLPF